MGLTKSECKEKGGKIYNLENTERMVCILPEAKEEKKKAVLID